MILIYLMLMLPTSPGDRVGVVPGEHKTLEACERLGAILWGDSRPWKCVAQEKEVMQG